MNNQTKKMKNKILAATSRTIPYIKQLNAITGSALSSILMQQLDYWFVRSEDDGTGQKDGSFYKFLEPCSHNKYKEGESWTEELGLSKAEFRTAFDNIGVRYTSKREFKAQTDPFQGKFYCSYHDRIKGITIYVRNNEVVDFAIDRVFKNAPAKGINQPSRKSTSFTSVNQECEFTEVKKVNLHYTESTTESNKKENEDASYAAMRESSGLLAEGENEKNILLYNIPPQETAQPGFFSKLNLQCQNLFGNDYYTVSLFLQQMTIQSEDQLFFFAKTLSERYERRDVLCIMHTIDERLRCGEIAKYTPKYVLNALDRLAKLPKEEDMDAPQKIYKGFKKYCFDTFGEGDLGREVYSFYTKILSTKTHSREEESHMTQRRIDNVKALTTKYGTDYFLKAIRIFKEKKENGTLNSNTLQSFTSYVKKMATGRKEAEPLFTDLPREPRKEREEPIVPTLQAKFQNEYEGKYELYNWNFTCECGRQVTRFEQSCKSCGGKFDWETATERFKAGVTTDDRRATS
jgi:hypothetical protein